MASGLALLPAPAFAQYATGKGSLGGSVGVPILLATSELKAGQRPRLMGKAHFQYVLTHQFRLSMRGGFGWLGYTRDEPAPFPLQAKEPGGDPTRIDQLTILNPFSAVLQYTRMVKNWQAFAGAGPGMVRVNILNDRRTIFDPVTHERYSYWSPSVGGEAGGEYFIPANRNVSFEGVGTFHYLLKRNAEKFPSGYSGHHALFDFSVGVNVYFNPPGAAKPATPATAPEGTPEEKKPPESTPETPAEPQPKPDNP